MARAEVTELNSELKAAKGEILQKLEEKAHELRERETERGAAVPGCSLVDARVLAILWRVDSNPKACRICSTVLGEN